jgi:hypothetical protein
LRLARLYRFLGGPLTAFAFEVFTARFAFEALVVGLSAKYFFIAPRIEEAVVNLFGIVLRPRLLRHRHE